MGYTLLAKFASEAIGMALTIFLGESILANELLPSTKGHAMGILAVSLGFGLAFGVNIAWFGAISAHLNPGMFFFLAVLGKLDDGWAEFAVGSLADFIGAFFGAVLVYLHFSEHFWTVPSPEDENPVTRLLYGLPDALAENAARIASAGPDSKKPEGRTIRKEFRDAGKKFRGGKQDDLALLEKMELRRRVHQTYRKSRGDSFHSIQVADVLHQHDPQILERMQSADMDGGGSGNNDDADYRRHSVQVAGLLHARTLNNLRQTGTDDDEEKKADNNNDGVSPDDDENDETLEQGQEAYQAAMDADAHAKLSIFATRPAKYNRVANFYQEMMASAALFFGAEMFNLRRAYDSVFEVSVDGQLMKALFVSLFIAMLILGLGGTTGLAVNPARDFAPRLAHAVLPIPGKGSSEWHYAVVPFFAPFVGAVIGAGLYKGIEALYETRSE